jgi:CubicO group peptidase (beta-lactamase class C family)
MHDTQYAWDRATDDARFAHWFDTSGREHPRDYKATVLNAADDLMTTIEDYGKFAAYVLQSGGLDSSVFNQMVRPHVPTKDGRFMTLGWEVFLNLGPQKEYALVHSGSDAGVQTLVIVLPLSGQGLVVFTNGDNGYKLYDKLVAELLDRGKEIMAQ